MFGILKGHVPAGDPLRMNEIVLAYLGDCVYELYVRNLSVETGNPKVYELNRISSQKSKASYQADALKGIMPELTETETGLVKRAKNKKITSKPKNAEPGDYKMATAYEALIGYLYLTEQWERMDHIIGLGLKVYEAEESSGDGDTGVSE